MNRPGGGTALALPVAAAVPVVVVFAAPPASTRVRSISSACAAFFEALLLWSTVASSELAACALTTVAVEEPAVVAGVAEAARGADAVPRSITCPSKGGVVPGKARGGGGTAPGGRSVAVLLEPSSSPMVDMAARGGRGSPRVAAGLPGPSVPKLDGASVSRGASFGGIDGNGGGGNAAAVGWGAAVGDERGSVAARPAAVGVGDGLLVVATTAGIGAVTVVGAVAAGAVAAGAVAGVVLPVVAGRAGPVAPLAALGVPATLVVAGLRWLLTGGGGGPDDLPAGAWLGGTEFAGFGGATDGVAGRRTGGGGGFEE